MGDRGSSQFDSRFQTTMNDRIAYGNTRRSPPTGMARSEGYGKSDPQIFGSSMYPKCNISDRTHGVASTLTTSASDPSVLGASILIRRLSRGINSEALNAMLIFAGDLIGTEFVRSPYADDATYQTAMARFRSEAGAFDAQQKLNGKPNTAKDANMIVEVLSGSALDSPFERRNTIDGLTSRTQNSSASSTGSISGPPGGRSRFGSTFQSGDKVSPPLPTPGSCGNGEFPKSESSAHLQNLFSPQSPLSNGVHNHRSSGKSTINDDSADDETGELLKDPIAYARNDQQPFARRSSAAQDLGSRFGSLSLSTESGYPSGLSSPQTAGLVSPRSTTHLQSPLSPTAYGSSNGNGAFSAGNPRQYPPANPADQNPPCNTLYVGNLPVDTSEDELKSLFQRQRGYRRLCFRTKQQGPMCFVEFEDVGFATRALHDLYGVTLHNSVKGGIRLSFSKNPLGVRSAQPNGMIPNGQMQTIPPGLGGQVNGGAQGFSSVSGPPPGLGGQPGLPNGHMDDHVNGNGYRAPLPPMDSMFSNPFGSPKPFGTPSQQAAHDFAAPLGPRTTMSGGVPPGMGNATFSREGDVRQPRYHTAERQYGRESQGRPFSAGYPSQPLRSA